MYTSTAGHQSVMVIHAVKLDHKRFAGPKCLGQIKYVAEVNHILGDTVW